MRNPVAYWVGKWVVRLHYKQKLDLYSLPSIHAPELWARTQRKQKIPINLRWEIWRRDEFTCVYCDLWGHNLSLDHVVPEKYGGKIEKSNLVTACTKCNVKKGESSFDDFVKSKWLAKKRRHQPSLTTGTTPLSPQALKQQILERIGKST